MPRGGQHVVVGGSPAQSEMLAGTAARTLAGRVGTTAEIVHTVLFLMDNGYVNGIDLAVDGGLR